MSATVQTSSTKLDVSSTVSPVNASGLAVVGEGAVASPFASVFAAVQAVEAPTKAVAEAKSEAAPHIKAVKGDLSEEEITTRLDAFDGGGDPIVPKIALVQTDDAFLTPITTAILPEKSAAPIGSAVEASPQQVIASLETTIAPLPTKVALTAAAPVAPVQKSGVVKTVESSEVGQKIDTSLMTSLDVQSVDPTSEQIVPVATKSLVGPFALVAMEQNPELGEKTPTTLGLEPAKVGSAADTKTLDNIPDATPATPIAKVSTIPSNVVQAQPVLEDAPLAFEGAIVSDDTDFEDPEGEGIGSFTQVKGSTSQSTQPLVANIGSKKSNDGKVEINPIDMPDDLTVEQKAPLVDQSINTQRDAASVHPFATAASVAPKRIGDTDEPIMSAEGLNDDEAYLEGNKVPIVPAANVQTRLNSGTVFPSAGQATRAVRDATNQRAINEVSKTTTLTEKEASVDPSLAPSPTSNSTPSTSNTAAPAAPTGFTSSTGAAAILDVRRQGWTKTLVNRAAGLARAGGSMTLSILPQNLGQITLKLSDGRKGLELRMTADVASTTAMLREVQGQIESAFEQSGLKLGSYSAQTGGHGQQGGSNNGEPREETEVEVLEGKTTSQSDETGNEDPDRLNILL
jgi:hypothetical protein